MRRASATIARWRSSWRHWREDRRARAELAACPVTELSRIAADLGVSSNELRDCQSHPGPSELLPQRLQQLGVNARALQDATPATYRDLMLSCAACTSWRKCRKDLTRGNVQAGMTDYCLNAGTIEALTVRSQAGHST
jgi:uncharacterized protein YjiS (DUF1127 family)